MNDIELRLDRAERNVQSLHDDIAAFHSPEAHTYSTFPEIDPDGNGVIRVKVAKEPPREWGLKVGDILTDLRFALDYIAYRAVIKQTGLDPPPGAGAIEFPIFLHKGQFEMEGKGSSGRPTRRSGLSTIARMSPKAARFIQGVQPYGPGNGGDTSWLWYLHVLCNVNKHRFVPLTPAFLKVHELDLVTEFALVDQVQAVKVNPLQDGAVMVKFHVNLLPGGTPKVNVKSALTVDITFEPGPPAHGQDLATTLNGLTAGTKWVYGELKSEI